MTAVLRFSIISAVPQTDFRAANTALNRQMEVLPTFLRDRIAELATAVFSPAYLELSNDGRVLAWGGDLDCHGIGAPKQNMPADACTPFLKGVSPLHQAALTRSFPPVFTGFSRKP